MDFLIWGQDLVLALGYFGVFLSVFLMAIIYGVPTPDVLVVIFAAGFLNPLIVALFATAASVIAEAIPYFFARKGFFMSKKLEGKRLNMWRAKLKGHRIYLPLFAAMPIPSGFLGVACGILHFEKGTFIVGLTLGRFVRMLTFAVIGFVGWNLLGLVSI
jgi:membrane protein YqaA with SNARE-associated domain